MDNGPLQDSHVSATIANTSTVGSDILVRQIFKGDFKILISFKTTLVQKYKTRVKKCKMFNMLIATNYEYNQAKRRRYYVDRRYINYA